MHVGHAVHGREHCDPGIHVSMSGSCFFETGSQTVQFLPVRGLVANGIFPARELPRALRAQGTETVIAPSLFWVGPEKRGLAHSTYHTQLAPWCLSRRVNDVIHAGEETA